MFGQTYADVIERDNPVCWWRMGIGTATPNAAGGIDTDLLSPTGSGANLPYGGPRLDGAPDGVSSHCIGSTNSTGQGWATASHNLPGTVYTYEIWAYATAAPAANSSVFGRYNTTSAGTGRRWQGLELTTTQVVNFRAQGTNLNVTASSAGAFVLSRWNHLVATVNEPLSGNNNLFCALWVNGRMEVRTDGTAYDASASHLTGVGISGIAHQSATNLRSFPGFLAEATIYPYTLSPSQIINHYQAGMAARSRNLPLYPFTATVTPSGLTSIGDVTNKRIALVSDRPR